MLKTTRLLTALLFAALMSAGCSAREAPADPPSEIITVLAAASLTDAFKELGPQFEAANPGARVQFNFAGSQQLARQIAQGAPGDVFASASLDHMNAAVQDGRVDPGAVRAFARNRLVVVVPAANPAALMDPGDLANPGLKLVLAAREVPVGRYSLEFLASAEAAGIYGPGYQDRVLASVVSYEENVRSVLTKVGLGEADAGIVYASDAASADAARVLRLEIPEALNVTAEYPIAPISDSPHPGLADRFVEFVLSEQGQAALVKWGFAPGE